MSEPKPICETPWMKAGAYFFDHHSSGLGLCRDHIEKLFELHWNQRIKIGLFDRQVGNSVKVECMDDSPDWETFEVDGVQKSFDVVAHDRLLRVMKQRNTKTLYAKCYIDA